MRAPKRRRPRQDEQLEAGPETDLAEMAEKVSYAISREHKNGGVKRSMLDTAGEADDSVLEAVADRYSVSPLVVRH